MPNGVVEERARADGGAAWEACDDQVHAEAGLGAVLDLLDDVSARDGGEDGSERLADLVVRRALAARLVAREDVVQQGGRLQLLRAQAAFVRAGDVGVEAQDGGDA